MKLEINWAAISDQGNHRPENQDNFAADGNLFMVADGMGGHKGGAEASRLAISVVQNSLKYKAYKTPGVISDAISAANREIYAAGLNNQEKLGGMGTTLCVLYLTSNVPKIPGKHREAKDFRVAAGNVGDSRIYKFQNGELTQISQDHNDEINKHMLTRAVGTQPTVTTDIWELVPFTKQSGAKRSSTKGSNAVCYLLCSDGLTNEVSDSVIQEILTEHVGEEYANPSKDPPKNIEANIKAKLEKAAEALLNQALENGGRDNITLILIQASLVGAADSAESGGSSS